MRTEKPCTGSPFSALTYQEQQDRWLEWRSRQLDYRAADQPDDTPQEHPFAEPLLRVPNMPIAAPTRHRELDQVLARHARAVRQAGSFRSLTTP